MNNLQEQTKSVGIIGCGWLGKALVPALINEQYQVIATTQTLDKLADIEALGASAELLSLPLSGEQMVENYQVFHCDVLVICITPQIRHGQKDYPEKVAQLVSCAQQSQVSKIILISSTAVYDGYVGEVSEALPLKTELEKVAILAEAEQQVVNFSGDSIVLRCAGLVGEDRQPGRFFRQGRVLTQPNAYVNLIHQTDVVQQLMLLISSNVTGIFNAVADMKVTKQQFYTAAAKALNLAPPCFDEQNSEQASKRVVGDKLRQALNYQYHYPDLVQWLNLQ
ncbi:NAD(P)H-binding protein [Thalassotalea sp. G2M2-11]|uniref:NAD(P)H-binding protein n=1 Tax=Thalassotalea sp. G2M2-11 TaxID=2787627 RepID=UPI0019D121ED